MSIAILESVPAPAAGLTARAGARSVADEGAVFSRAADLFYALGDPARLRVLALLRPSELCVSAIAGALGEEMSTVSQRLRLLRFHGLVARRKQGKTRVLPVGRRARRRRRRSRPRTRRGTRRSVLTPGDFVAGYVHNRHEHEHGPACGHLAVQHDEHVDYVHDGHLHHPHEDHVHEHELGPADLGGCDPSHACGSHASEHLHGVGCEHVAIPHAGHIDYIVDGHIHRQHDEHCDDHGALRTL